jgi:ABC-type methionine transport system ATPase subunit
MVTRSLHLDYSPSLASQPIVYQVIRRFDLEVNIRQAKITLEQGWLEVDVSGDADQIDRAVAWLIEAGLTVRELP